MNGLVPVMSKRIDNYTTAIQVIKGLIAGAMWLMVGELTEMVEGTQLFWCLLLSGLLISLFRLAYSASNILDVNKNKVELSFEKKTMLDLELQSVASDTLQSERMASNGHFEIGDDDSDSQAEVTVETEIVEVVDETNQSHDEPIVSDDGDDITISFEKEQAPDNESEESFDVVEHDNYEAGSVEGEYEFSVSTSIQDLSFANDEGMDFDDVMDYNIQRQVQSEKQKWTDSTASFWGMEGLHRLLEGIILATLYVVDPRVGWIQTMIVGTHIIVKHALLTVLFIKAYDIKYEEVCLRFVLLGLMHMLGVFIGYRFIFEIPAVKPWIVSINIALLAYLAYFFFDKHMREVEHKEKKETAMATAISVACFVFVYLVGGSERLF